MNSFLAMSARQRRISPYRKIPASFRPARDMDASTWQADRNRFSSLLSACFMIGSIGNAPKSIPPSFVNQGTFAKLDGLKPFLANTSPPTRASVDSILCSDHTSSRS
jgi:hypothetical protein